MENISQQLYDYINKKYPNWKLHPHDILLDISKNGELIEFKAFLTLIDKPSYEQWMEYAGVAAYSGNIHILDYIMSKYDIPTNYIASNAADGGQMDIYQRYRSFSNDDENDIEEQSNNDYTRTSYIKEDFWPPESYGGLTEDELYE